MTTRDERAADADEGGYEPFMIAEGWREETGIRFVPESAIAEAVAAERVRIVALLREKADSVARLGVRGAVAAGVVYALADLLAGES